MQAACVLLGLFASVSHFHPLPQSQAILCARQPGVCPSPRLGREKWRGKRACDRSVAEAMDVTDAWLLGRSCRYKSRCRNRYARRMGLFVDGHGLDE